MTQPSPSDPASVTLELERLRRVMEVGFSDQSGALQLLVQRHDQTDRYLDSHAAQLEQHDARLDALERGETDRQKDTAARLAELEQRRIPWRMLAAVAGVAAFLLALWQASPH